MEEISMSPLPTLRELREQLDLVEPLPRRQTQRNFYIIYAQVLEIMLCKVLLQHLGHYPKTHNIRKLIREVNFVCGFDLLDGYTYSQKQQILNMRLVPYRYNRNFTELSKPSKSLLYNFRDRLIEILRLR